MTMLLGCLGMAQALLLPGLAVLAFLSRLDTRQRLLLAVPLSVLVNQYLALLLLGLGVAGRPAWATVVVVECGLIYYGWRHRIVQKKQPLARLHWLDCLLLAVALAAVGKYLEAWGRDFGAVFSQIDAVASWNRWAKDWAGGIFPRITYFYAQGLPTLFSLPYVFLGTDKLQIFSKAVAGWIFLASLLALLDLGFRRPKLRRLSWLAVYLYGMVQARFFQSHWASGYADIPLSSMVVFLFYAVYTAPKLPLPWIGLLGGTAAIVKQPGLMLAALSGIFGRRGKWRNVPKIWLWAALACAPWYLVILARIHLFELDVHNLTVLALHARKSLAERPAWAYEMLTTFAPGAYLAALALLAVAGMAVSRQARSWLAWLGIPYFLVWALVFPYDIRNMAMSLFPFSLSASAALVWGAGWLAGRLGLERSFATKKWLRPLLWAFCAYAVFLVGKPFVRYAKAETLWDEQRRQEMGIGEFPYINERILALVNSPDFRGKVYTSYEWVVFPEPLLPHIEILYCPWQKELLEDKRSLDQEGYLLVSRRECGEPPAHPRAREIFRDENFVLLHWRGK